MSKSCTRRKGWRTALALGVLTTAVLTLTVAAPTARAASPSGWNIITSPNTGPTDNNLLMGSTCTNAWNCWAVGGVFSSLGNNSQPNALVDHWNGSTWSAGPDVTPLASKASLLWSVDCVTGSDCWAVGAEQTGGQNDPVDLVEHWNGSAWSVVPAGGISGYLFSVSCVSTSNCWAVGDGLDNQKDLVGAIIVHWDGSQWSQVPSAPSNQPFDQLDSVTCTSGSDCWAVGYAGPNQVNFNFIPGVLPVVAGAQALFEHWNGVAWSVVPTTGAPSPSGQYLSSVTCTGTSNCWAMGSTMDASGNPSTTLAEHWDGSAWTVTPSLNPPTPASIINAVTCIDASDCWATGTTNTASGQNETPTPFIENWNGSAWTIDPSPNVVVFGFLTNLACLRNTGCFATGFTATSVSNNTTFQTLIEQLQLAPSGNQGLWMTGSDGGVFAFGNAGFFGSAGGMTLNKPVVGMAATPDGGGYWLAASDGGIFSYGDAGFHGSAGGLTLNKPVVGMAATPDGGGYWLAASDGGIFSYGDAGFHGSAGGLTLNKPVVGMAATPDGGGYWLVASDGGIFSYGDAGFAGSTGALVLASPIVGMASTPDGGGYWLVASDGGVFAFGDAGFYGSLPGEGITRHQPVVGMTATPDGRGYWIVGEDGALYSYGDANYLGSLVGAGLAAPIVAAARS